MGLLTTDSGLVPRFEKKVGSNSSMSKVELAQGGLLRISELYLF